MSEADGSPNRILKILFTHSLGIEEQEILRKTNIEPLIFPLLKTKLFPTKKFSSSIPDHIHSWTFSSQKAVFALKLLEDLDVSKITAFAVGSKTANELQNLGFRKIITAQGDSLDLADEIKKYGAKSVVHFCGEFHRPELKNSLTAQGIEVNEVICYTTEKVRLPIALDNISGISFSSPRGVEALKDSFKHLSHEMVLFSIGSTTAKSINSLFPENPIVTSDQPSKTALTDSILQYYSTNLCQTQDS